MNKINRLCSSIYASVDHEHRIGSPVERAPC
jgi:hypothetical protein